MLSKYLSFSIGCSILILLIGLILQWLQVPTGNLVDWLIGIVSFWWLIIIVTLPWNVYFDTRETIAEAAISQQKGIPIEQQQLNYVKKISNWSIIIAILLHLISALVLYLLAVTGISTVGYVSSLATLLLTALRPAIRGYQYLASRLSMIRQQIKYPREDIFELRDRIKQIESSLSIIDSQLNINDPVSLIAKQQQQAQDTRQELHHLKAFVEQLAAKNNLEHEQLARETTTAISQLTEDSQVLNHVREIIHFFKTA
ncbi:hypothetical protein Sta7437_3630 [Stanieria cyanosphaera PCC 7437]|uniref:Uncharacterized protein n=1 Tax=Stanieria cyanosphaera (strain ATCC 29371 / PCC 7437) TaxID=111780 RepID=K9XX83_STAC7|nr:hypothetical protein [Stanieria cyanosphaera]AFZ37128.1 hypothetical protein Sta7437_3630 [Stanieria cyanosphaera PCC 7437]